MTLWLESLCTCIVQGVKLGDKQATHIHRQSPSSTSCQCEKAGGVLEMAALWESGECK